MFPTFDFERIIAAFIWLFLAAFGFGIFGGCGLPDPYRAETRLGWSPFRGFHFSDTKDNRVTGEFAFDAEKNVYTGKFEIDNRAETANASLVPLAENYRQQLDVQREQTAIIASLVKAILSASIGPDGIKLGGASSNGTMTPVP